MSHRKMKEAHEQEVRMTDTTVLPERAGTRPHTTPWAPHIQQDQRGSLEMQAALADQ